MEEGVLWGDVVSFAGRAIGQEEGDAIRLISASWAWTDHNTLYPCQDNLIDATLGSTNVTISETRHGNNAGSLGKQSLGRMGRVCNWWKHATHIQSEANNFTESGNKEEIFLPSVFQDQGEATQMKGFDEKSMPWNFYCVEDLFEIGVSFNQTGIGAQIRDADPKLTEKKKSILQHDHGITT
ncbi:hypothetical protein POTOM_017044 [Populus tomentosa]|uniref:Uncharacterized protein n=1 Tax=Populus tomentosa TaxID=118781 RepID=A0A8X7ZZQ0_POPTO|nr:hypothetical protein POTOM_017044 [Populus tomentosa]